MTTPADGELTAPPTRRGKKNPYEVARPAPASRSLALIDYGDEEDNPFALDDKPDYREVLPTQDEVRHKLMGSRGLKSISMFSGGGGALTGFAWSGWHDLAAVEFVKAARDSIALNYAAHIIEPDDVLKMARVVAKDMGMSEVKSVSDKKEHFNLADSGIQGVRGLVVNGQSRINGKIISASVNWEETRLRIGEEDFRLFRSRVNDRLIPMAEYARENDRMLIWGDDIRGLEGKLILTGYGLEWGELDGAHGGPPCFTAGTMVLCKDALRPIEEVEVGHEVLTHEGRWRRVVNTMSRNADTIYLDQGRIETTHDHPFYARNYSDPKRASRTLTDPEWIDAEKMEGMFWAEPKSIQEVPESERPALPSIAAELGNNFWWLVGLWIGDGWLRYKEEAGDVPTPKINGGKLHDEPQTCANGGCDRPSVVSAGAPHKYTSYCSRACRVERNAALKEERRGLAKKRGGVYLALGTDEARNTFDELVARTGGALNWKLWDAGTSHKAAAGNIELARWLNTHIGRGAHNKSIPGWMLGLPESARRELLAGYVHADGKKKGMPEHKTGFRSVSYRLALGMKLLASSLGWHTSWRNGGFAQEHTMPDTVIEGRTVHQSRFYEATLYDPRKAPHDKTFVVDEFGLHWHKMRSPVEDGRKNVKVYDITVEEDHSFVANGYVVHNCKGFSHSGIRERGWGLTHRYSDERFQQVDELFFEFVRVLGEVGAKTFLAENVVGIGDAEARESHFNPIIEAFEVAGYRVEARPMKASEYGVPQTRPRMIFQGVRADLVDRDTRKPLNPVWPSKCLHVYTVGDALRASSHLNSEAELAHADLGDYESGRTWDRLKPGEFPKNKQFNMMRLHPDMPVPTITATGASEASSAGACHPHERRKFTITELLALTSFPQGYQLAGNFRQQGERIGRTACPLMIRQIGDKVADMLANAVSTKEGKNDE